MAFAAGGRGRSRERTTQHRSDRGLTQPRRRELRKPRGARVLLRGTRRSSATQAKKRTTQPASTAPANTACPARSKRACKGFIRPRERISPRTRTPSKHNRRMAPPPGCTRNPAASSPCTVSTTARVNPHPGQPYSVTKRLGHAGASTPNRVARCGSASIAAPTIHGTRRIRMCTACQRRSVEERARPVTGRAPPP